MKRLIFTCAFLLYLALLCSAGASAQNRTWVSGVGDNLNPGSRTAPCKTFTGAFSKTSAGGEIDALDAGQFNPITVTKSITLDGGAVVANINFNATNGVVINAGPTDTIVLRRISMNGQGSGLRGVQVLAAGSVVIEDCYISNASGSGVEVNTTTPVRLAIQNSYISGNSTGIKVTAMPAGSNVSLDNVQITGATHGVDLMTGTLDVSNSLIAQNTGVGLLAEGGTLNSINNLVSNNGQDVQFTGGVVHTFSTAGPVGLSLTQDSSVATIGAGQSAVFNLTVAPRRAASRQP
jgi:hypothetical protein